MKFVEKIREFFGAIDENKGLRAEVQKLSWHNNLLKYDLQFQKSFIKELLYKMKKLEWENESLQEEVVESEDDYAVMHFEKKELEKEFDFLKHELNQSKEVAFAYQVQAKSLADEMNEFLEEKAKLIEELESLEDRVGDLEQLCEMKDEEMDKLKAELAKANRMQREHQKLRSYFTIQEQE